MRMQDTDTDTRSSMPSQLRVSFPCGGESINLSVSSSCQPDVWACPQLGVSPGLGPQHCIQQIEIQLDRPEILWLDQVAQNGKAWKCTSILLLHCGYLCWLVYILRSWQTWKAPGLWIGIGSESFGIISYGNVTRNETTYKLHFVEHILLYDLIISRRVENS